MGVQSVAGRRHPDHSQGMGRLVAGPIRVNAAATALVSSGRHSPGSVATAAWHRLHAEASRDALECAEGRLPEVRSSPRQSPKGAGHGCPARADGHGRPMRPARGEGRIDRRARRPEHMEAHPGSSGCCGVRFRRPEKGCESRRSVRPLRLRGLGAAWRGILPGCIQPDLARGASEERRISRRDDWGAGPYSWIPYSSILYSRVR